MGFAERSHAVIVAGGGPTGLMLAGELALAGVDVAIVERRTSQELEGSRAGGLHSRTIEVLDQRGIAGRFISQGTVAQVCRFASTVLDMSDFPTRHPYGLALSQNHFERILAGWVDELGVPIYRGQEVTGFVQDGDCVRVGLVDGRRLETEYLVGCDGGRSVVRKMAGIEFAGFEATMSWLIAEVETAEEPAWGFRQTPTGAHAIGKMEDGKRARIVLTESRLQLESKPSLEEFREALIAAYGSDFGVHSPTWISRFTDVTRQAVAYRDRRVLLAGDAAHIHPPMGGQGLNIGIQDAVNLGWKLAGVVKGWLPESILDTYHAERHPVGARVQRFSMAQVAVRREDERSKALGGYIAQLLTMDEPRRRLAAEVSGLDVRYDLGEGHPLLGRRMPDLDLVTGHEVSRVFDLLHDARPVLLSLDAGCNLDVTAWADRVRLVQATYSGVWELPAIGVVPAPKAVLIRPDGYVAWVGDGAGTGLIEALTCWAGAAG